MQIIFLDWVSVVYWERLEINFTVSTYTFFVNYFFPGHAQWE